MKIVGIAVALAIFGFTFGDPQPKKPLKLNECTCTHYGNHYEVYSDDDCRSFHQSVQGLLGGGKITCRLGQKFDVEACTCNWPSAVNCPKGCRTEPVTTPVTFDRVNVTCVEEGNTYELVPGSECTKFSQVANDGTGQRKIHTCPKPDVLAFDVDECVCNLRTAFSCPI